MDVFSEEKLVAGCRRGDKRAYAALVSLYARHVFAVSFGVVGNVHGAEDVAQEALLQGLVQIASLRKGERFGPWICRIARNLAIDLVRLQKMHKQAAAQIQLQQRAESTEDYHVLEKAIERLDVTYRETLLLYYFDGERTEDVAEKLNISPATVLSRLSRARRQLSEIFEPQQETDD